MYQIKHLSTQQNISAASQSFLDAYDGNVDLLHRPLIPGSRLTAAGWENVSASEAATVYSSTFSAGDQAIGYDYAYSQNVLITLTPIKADGTVLSPSELENYVADIITDAVTNSHTLMAEDAANDSLFLRVVSVTAAGSAGLDSAYQEDEIWTVRLHDQQEEYYLTFQESWLYNQADMTGPTGMNPKASLEVNDAGSVSFIILPNHPLYNTVTPIASYISAFDDGEEIFYGRVISRSEPTITGQVTIQCEGALSFLGDSQITPDAKDRNGNQITRTLTAEAFFRWCIDEHNADVADPRRQFTVGIINANKKDIQDEYSISKYTATKDAITSNILNIYGGFIRVRPDGNGGHYIDWIQNYETVDPQAIQIGTNIEDQTNDLDGANMFTVLLPVGNDGLTLPERSIDLYPPAEMNKYGRIVKPIDFNSATTVENLRSQANDYKARIEKTLFVNSSIQFVDMHYLDGTIPKVTLGARFTNLPGLSGSEMIASALELEFEAPQNNQVNFLNRKSLDPDLTPEGNGHGRNAKRTSSRGRGAQTFKWLKEIDDLLMVTAPKVEMQGEKIALHYNEYLLTANQMTTLSRVADSLINTADDHEERINDIAYRVNQVEGTGVIQNDNFISNLAGHFEIWTDPDGKVTVHLKDGAEMAIDRANGSMITVGQMLDLQASNYAGIAGYVEAFSGSALWTQRNNITEVVGMYDVHTYTDGNGITHKELVVKEGGALKIRQNGINLGLYHEGNMNGGIVIDMINGHVGTKISGSAVDINANNVHINANSTLDSIVGHFVEEEFPLTYGPYNTPIFDPVTGEQVYGKRLVYVADGGMKVRRLDNEGVLTEFGVYDNGNLTGGVMAQKINGQTTTLIRGDRILIGNISGNDLDTWAADKEGLIAANATLLNATVQNLSAVEARVQTLETDYLQTDDLEAEIAGITSLGVQHIAASGSISFKKGNHYIAVDDAICELQIVPSGNTYTLQKKTWANSSWTDVNSFSRAVASWETGWSNGVFTATAKPQNQSAETTLKYLAPTGNVGKNGKLVNRTFKVQYGPDVMHLTDTGFEQEVSISAIEVYNDGWGAARAKCSIPASTSYSDSMSVSIPPATVDGDAVSYTYTLDFDNDYVYIKQGTTTIARKAQSLYSNGRGSVAIDSHYALPYTENSPGTMVKVYAKASNNAEDTIILYLSTSGGYAYVRKNGWNGDIVGQIAVPNPSATDVTSHYAGTYNDGNPGTIIPVYATATDGLTSDTDTIYLYLSTSGGYAYVRKNGWNGDVVGQIAVPNPSATDITSHYAGTYNDGNPGTIIPVHATATDGLTSDTDTIYLYLSTSGGYTYVRKNDWNGDVVGRISTPVQNVEVFPSDLHLLNGNKLTMYAASGAAWLNGEQYYWYYSNVKHT